MEAAKKNNYDVVAHSVFKNINGKDIQLLPNDIGEIDIDVNKYRGYLYDSCLLNQSLYGYLFPKELRCGPEMSYPVLKIFKKSFLMENKLSFPENIRFCEDKVFELTMVSKLSNLYYINIPLYHYFVRPGSLTNRRAEDKTRDYIYIFECLKKTMEELGIFKDHEKIYNLNIVGSCWNVIEKYGMGIKTVGDLEEAKRKMIEFVNSTLVSNAIASTSFKVVKGIKHIFLFCCMKMKAYRLAIIICHIYYTLLPHKNSLLSS